MARTHVDEWWEQDVRCRLYEKKGQPGLPEYVKCGNDGWPKKELLLVYVKAGDRPTEAVLSHKRFPGLVAFAQACSAGVDNELELRTTSAEIGVRELRSLRVMSPC